jgi:hypothetical protein
MFIGEAFKIFDKASCRIIGIADVIVMDFHMRVPTHFESFRQINNLQGKFTAKYNNQYIDKGRTQKKYKKIKISKPKHKDHYIYIQTILQSSQIH